VDPRGSKGWRFGSAAGLFVIGGKEQASKDVGSLKSGSKRSAKSKCAIEKKDCVEFGEGQQRARFSDMRGTLIQVYRLRTQGTRSQKDGQLNRERP